jgi:gentisate 1,2-dioxygenase
MLIGVRARGAAPTKLAVARLLRGRSGAQGVAGARGTGPRRAAPRKICHSAPDLSIPVPVQLGRLEELPSSYVARVTAAHLAPLWPQLRSLVPQGRPSTRTLPTLWRYVDIRPLLLEAGELAPIEKAERRVLALCNPGLGLETLRATATIYLGMQLIKPGEAAPTHRHTPTAIRLVIEGEGGYTVVSGEKLPMERGDLILTPSRLWHEHGHEGKEPVIWLDALDMPLLASLEASYAIEGPPQPLADRANSSARRYAQGGLVPYRALDRASADYPLMRFPWSRVRATLEDLSKVTPRHEAVHMAYVNPETGRECLPTLGFSALMLRPAEVLQPNPRSASAVMHAIEGAVDTMIDAQAFRLEVADSVAIPTHARLRIGNASSTKPAFVFLIDDAPLQRKLGFYEEFAL